MEISLIQPSLADVGTILNWYGNPEVAEYFRRYPPIQDWSRPDQLLVGLGWSYLILDPEKKPIGLIQLLNNDPAAKTIEVGLLIDKEDCADRKEASKDAYYKIMSYIFDYLDYNKAYMKILTHRTKLRQRLESGGWRVEAHFRKSCRFKNELHDEYVLALFKTDYKRST